MTNGDQNWAKYERRIGLAMVVNFVVFWVIGVSIGGDTINRHIDGGIHYLSSHGVDTAVLPLVWYYSLTHASVVIGCFVLFFAYTALSGLVRHRPNRPR